MFISLFCVLLNLHLFQSTGKIPGIYSDHTISFHQDNRNNKALATYNSFPHFPITCLPDMSPAVSENCVCFIAFFVLLLIKISRNCHQKKNWGQRK